METAAPDTQPTTTNDDAGTSEASPSSDTSDTETDAEPKEAAVLTPQEVCEAHGPRLYWQGGQCWDHNTIDTYYRVGTYDPIPTPCEWRRATDGVTRCLPLPQHFVGFPSSNVTCDLYDRVFVDRSPATVAWEDRGVIVTINVAAPGMPDSFRVYKLWALNADGWRKMDCTTADHTFPFADAANYGPVPGPTALATSGGPAPASFVAL